MIWRKEKAGLCTLDYLCGLFSASLSLSRSLRLNYINTLHCTFVQVFSIFPSKACYNTFSIQSLSFCKVWTKKNKKRDTNCILLSQKPHIKKTGFKFYVGLLFFFQDNFGVLIFSATFVTSAYRTSFTILGFAF